jgi:hypothetical protein
MTILVDRSFLHLIITENPPVNALIKPVTDFTNRE